MIIATAGHVDHGKTSLIRQLTGVDTDRLPEEKRRGMTIDLGFAHLETANGRRIGFVDVPGHEHFVHNMLAGMTGIDCALLVVAADDGPMPQTREHLAILELIGVPVGAVALTKIDAVEPARAEVAAGEVSTLLAAHGAGLVPVFPLSVLTGAGVEPLRAHLQAMDGRSARAGDHLRMTVDRAFTLPGAGLIVTGTVLSGSVAAGDMVEARPAGAAARVRGLRAHDRGAPRAVAGERCALNLAGATAAISRGDWIVAPDVAPAVTRIDVMVQVLAGEARPLAHWTPLHVHLGAADVTGRVALLEAASLAPGETGLAQLVLDRPLQACHGDRAILRDQSARRTLGGARVIDIFAPPRGRARPARLALLHALDRADHGEALRAALAVSPSGLEPSDFARARNLDAAHVQRLLATAGARVAGSVAFETKHWNAAKSAALAALAAWHARSPASPGVPEDRLLHGTALRVKRDALAVLAADLLADGSLKRHGAALALATHDSGLNDADEALARRIAAFSKNEPAQAPTCAEIAAGLKLPVRQVKSLQGRMAQMRRLVRIGEERFMPPAAARTLAAHAEALGGADRKQRFTAAQFRDRSGLGRNLAIEVLEAFDRLGLTRRLGNERLVMKSAEQVFGADQGQAG